MANKKIKHVIAKLLGEDTTETLDIYDESALHAENIKNNLTTTNAGYALDARQGKALKDAVDKRVLRGANLTNAYLSKQADEERYNIVFNSSANTGRMLIAKDTGLWFQGIDNGTYTTKWNIPSNLDAVGNNSYLQHVTGIKTSVAASENTKIASFTVTKKGRYIFRPYFRINSMDTTHAVWFYISNTTPSAHILYYEQAVAFSPLPASGVFQGNGGIAIVDLNPDTTYFVWCYCAAAVTLNTNTWFSLHCLRAL